MLRPRRERGGDGRRDVARVLAVAGDGRRDVARVLAAGGAALLLSLGACASTPAPGGAPGPAPAIRALARAQPGDTVYLVEHYVRPERRQQFEDFVAGVLWPAWERVGATNATRAVIASQTRMLRPVAANDDGTYTYTFILDPVVAGESYNVLDLLREVYPEEQATQEYERFTEMWAREFTSRAFVQVGTTPGS